MITEQNVVIPSAMPPGVGPAPAVDVGTGQKIRALREERNMSEIDLATAAGMLPDHLVAIEAGLEPTIPEKQAIAAALNLAIEDIG
jgi:DNA-binding XRE family transcriptional regulator